MNETYDKFQERIVRDARRIQEKADTEFARQRFRARGQGWVQGYEARQGGAGGTRHHEALA